MENGATLINFAAEELIEYPCTLSDPRNDTELLLFGVGMERVLNGVYLKVDPEGYVSYVENNSQSPSFGDSKQVVIEDLRVPIFRGRSQRVE